ncbi:MAG: sulfite exporter TauE/SafE family protein [Rivularia sp. ALOHA_DT_140]|nr:sulfite exporter TauE/SafE family protein [Rivularia sp. ALOHA_DT_140]
MIANWEITVTMIFGSMVAGGTSMGGGAVAFPVLTKWLEIPAHEAKVFSLAIQSVGMGAASLTIIAMKTRVEWRFIPWATLGGIAGIILGTIYLAPILPPQLIKMSFTMMISSFAVVVVIFNWIPRKANSIIPFWGNKEKIVSLGVGIIGGIISSLVGSGMDIFSFSVMVLLFNLSETISTPTSVILMSINAITGFLFHLYFIQDFVQPVINYWLAAVPVVVIGAPAGALLCSLLKRETIIKVVIGLILIELVSYVILIPLNFKLLSFSTFIFIVFSLVYYWMHQNQSYSK